VDREWESVASDAMLKKVEFRRRFEEGVRDHVVKTCKPQGGVRLDARNWEAFRDPDRYGADLEFMVSPMR
jgi:hypothetical protein